MLATLPLKIFAVQRRGGPSGTGVSTSPSHAATLLTLNSLLEHLAVSKHQLADLLGIPTHSDMWKWWNIKTARSPSPLYWTRIMQLVFMQAEGIPVCLMKSIDWEKSVIKWRDGHVTYPGVVPERGGAIPEAVGDNHKRLAETLAQQAGHDGALPRSTPYRRKNDPGPVY